MADSWDDDSGYDTDGRPDGSSPPAQVLSAAGPFLPLQALPLPTGNASPSWRDYSDLRRYEALDNLARERSWYDTPKSVWIGCNAGPGVDQVNGISISGSDRLAEKYANAAISNQGAYFLCNKTGRGDQTNGLKIHCPGEARQERRIDPDAHYNGAVYRARDANNQLGVQTQGLKVARQRNAPKSTDIQHHGAASEARGGRRCG